MGKAENMISRANTLLDLNAVFYKKIIRHKKTGKYDPFKGEEKQINRNYL